MNPTHDIARSELAAWRAEPQPAAFPYDAVIAAFHAVGKQFVASELLVDLERARDDVRHGCPAHRRLARFLDTVLDKFDGRYDQPSYLALDELGLPGADGCPAPGHARHARDRQALPARAARRPARDAAAGDRRRRRCRRPDGHG